MLTRLKSDSRGAALIEAALVLPVLLVLVFGIADLALFLWQSNAAQKAVQLGARKAIVSSPVAAGSGLTMPESATYWVGRPLGTPCAPAADGTSACPVFTVECTMLAQCGCTGAGCSYAFVEASLTPIYEAMRAILGRLRPEQVQIRYATNYLGYVGRPIPVPVDVTVSIVGMRHDLLFLNGALGPSIPIRASATLPGENMVPGGLDR